MASKPVHPFVAWRQSLAALEKFIGAAMAAQGVSLSQAEIDLFRKDYERLCSAEKQSRENLSKFLTALKPCKTKAGGEK